jgi:hypothetical protein
VLQLVNTPDIYKENKYQRRNLLLYHCLLDSGLQKFNVSEQLKCYKIKIAGHIFGFGTRSRTVT